jgi:hypothetical protein
MPRTDARAVPRQGTARQIQSPGEALGPRSHAIVTHRAEELAELRAWAQAAAWLNEHGFAAAVPAPLVIPLARRGLIIWPASEGEVA